MTMREVKFHPKVMGCEGAILKNDAAPVCGGWVKLRPPAAAVWGIEMKDPVVVALPLDVDCAISTEETPTMLPFSPLGIWRWWEGLHSMATEKTTGRESVTHVICDTYT